MRQFCISLFLCLFGIPTLAAQSLTCGIRYNGCESYGQTYGCNGNSPILSQMYHAKSAPIISGNASIKADEFFLQTGLMYAAKLNAGKLEAFFQQGNYTATLTTQITPNREVKVDLPNELYGAPYVPESKMLVYDYVLSCNLN